MHWLIRVTQSSRHTLTPCPCHFLSSPAVPLCPVLILILESMSSDQAVTELEPLSLHTQPDLSYTGMGQGLSSNVSMDMTGSSWATILLLTSHRSKGTLMASELWASPLCLSPRWACRPPCSPSRVRLPDLLEDSTSEQKGSPRQGYSEPPDSPHPRRQREGRVPKNGIW